MNYQSDKSHILSTAESTNTNEIKEKNDDKPIEAREMLDDEELISIFRENDYSH